MTLARHSDYIREVKADQRRLLSAAQRREDKEDWETDTDSNSNMKVTVEALEGLCTETINPLYEYDTVMLQNWKRILVNILSQFPNKVHNHGHAYLLEDKKCFQKRSGLANGELPTMPTRPIRNDNAYSSQEYIFYLEIYNEHMDINRATVGFLKKLFPTKRVGRTRGGMQLVTNQPNGKRSV